MGAQAAQQVVGLAFPAEEEVILVRLEGSKAGKRIKQRFRRHCRDGPP